MKREAEKTMYYTDGNTVRKMQAAPVMPDYREERRRRELEEKEEELRRQNVLSEKIRKKHCVPVDVTLCF